MTLKTTLFLATALLGAGCLSSDDGDPPTTPEPTLPTAPPQTTGNEETTFDHDNSTATDPFELLEQLEDEGPNEVRARFHSCPKIRYRTIGRILGSRGVDMAATGDFDAANIYANADQALGVANYAARIGETTELTTASAAKLFDIFIAAAPEIIANLPNRVECQVGGVGAQLFNGDGQCLPDGIACLTGLPATPAHLELCNSFVANAPSLDEGKIIATAALAAAAHTCE